LLFPLRGDVYVVFNLVVYFYEFFINVCLIGYMFVCMYLIINVCLIGCMFLSVCLSGCMFLNCVDPISR
jgi:hypothetical protein